MSKLACQCLFAKPPRGAPGDHGCLTDAPTSREIPTGGLAPCTYRCAETGLEWIVEAREGDYGRYGWYWRLAPGSAALLFDLFGAGRCQGWAEWVARSLDVAGREDLAAAVRRKGLAEENDRAKAGELILGLAQNLARTDQWREIIRLTDPVLWPHLLRTWALAKFMVGEFADTVVPLLADLDQPWNRPSHARDEANGYVPNNDFWQAELLVVALFQADNRAAEEGLRALAASWPRSLLLGFCVAVLEARVVTGGDADRWRRDLLTRAENFAGLQAVFPLASDGQGRRVARHLQEWFHRAPAFERHATPALRVARARVLGILDPP